ncbi:MAG: FtsX-like permease family protein, partial [Myxococcota bacterium]
KMYEYDAKLAFISAKAARTFFELPARSVTGMMLQVDNPDASDRIGAALLEQMGGEPYAVLDWKSRNQTLFAALKLERIVAFVVLAFIILVASFSIVNTLTMSVIEKRKEIAILKTMGARDVGIMKVFLVQGLTVGAFGITLGLIVGLTFIGALESFGFWIPDDVYYIDSLPVHLEPLDGVLVALAALLIVWNFAVFPALRGSRLAPVEGLRDG